MERARKESEVALLKDRFGKMAVAVLTDFRGLDVESMVRLRQEFGEKDVEYRVVKNTLVSRAIDEEPFKEEVSSYLVDMTGIAWSYEDPTLPARIIRDFQKSNEHLKIKCGVLDGRTLTPEQVESLAKMPGREELLGQICALMIATPQALVRQMMGPPQSIVSLIESREKQLEEQG